MPYRAFVVNKDEDDFTASVQTLGESDLPEGNVTVAVDWSDLNYKDGLACTPNGRVVTSYPMTLGIDFAGTVVESSDSRYAAGDAVVATGYDLGTGHPGGYAERVRLSADWLSPMPDGMTSEEAMTLGTAGITAAMSIDVIEKAGIGPRRRPGHRLWRHRRRRFHRRSDARRARLRGARRYRQVLGARLPPRPGSVRNPRSRGTRRRIAPTDRARALGGRR